MGREGYTSIKEALCCLLRTIITPVAMAILVAMESCCGFCDGEPIVDAMMLMVKYLA